MDETRMIQVTVNGQVQRHAVAPRQSLVDFLRANPRAGVAAPKLLYPDGRLQHAGYRFPGHTQAVFELYPPPARLTRLVDSPLNGRYPASLYNGGSPFQVDHTLGAAFAVRAETAAECGWFDETFQMYCEEIDWQWRMARAGWERRSRRHRSPAHGRCRLL